MGVLIVVSFTGFRALEKLEHEGGTGTHAVFIVSNTRFPACSPRCLSLRSSTLFFGYCNFVARRWEDSHPAHRLPRCELRPLCFWQKNDRNDT